MASWFVLAATLLIQIIVANMVQGIPTLAPFIKADLNLSQAQVGLFTSYIFFGFFLGSALSGWLTDRLGSRNVLIGGAAVAALLILLLGRDVDNFPLLIVLLVSFGVMASAATPAGAQAISLAFDRQTRGFAMGLRQMGVPLGGALAAATLPAIAVASNWRTAASTAGMIALVGALVALLIYNRPQVRTLTRSRSKRGARPAGSLWRRDVVVACAAGTTLPIGQFIMVTYLLLYLRDSLGVPELRGALLLTLAQLVGAVSRVSLAALSDRLAGKRKPALLAVVGMTGVSALIISRLPATTPFAWVAVVILLYAACALGWQGLYFTLLTELSDDGWEGRVVGLGTTFTSIGIMSGPPLFGLIVDITQSYRTAWLALVGVVALGMLLLVSVRERPRETLPASIKT